MKIPSLHLLILTLIFSCIYSARVLSTETDKPELRFYDVEIVIYRNDRVPRDEETILPVSSPLLDENMLDLSSPRSIAAAAEKLYQIVPSEDMQLTEAVLNIVNSPRYSLLAHTAWRQPGTDKDHALPVWIKGGETFGPEYTSIDSRIEPAVIDQIAESGDDTVEVQTETEVSSAIATDNGDNNIVARLADSSVPVHPSTLYELEGNITVALSRYLHVYTDLVLRKPHLSLTPVQKTFSEQILTPTESAKARILNNHALKEHRRMRSKVLHYLDSPEFSMLILITPYDVQEMDVEQEAAPLIDNPDVISAPIS